MRKSNSATRVLLTLCTFPTQSHLGKKQPQAKILVAFLFSQLHFNNVALDALFHGGHLLMRSKKCAMQNQRLTQSRPQSLRYFCPADGVKDRGLCNLRSGVIVVFFFASFLLSLEREKNNA